MQLHSRVRPCKLLFTALIGVFLLSAVGCNGKTVEVFTDRAEEAALETERFDPTTESMNLFTKEESETNMNRTETTSEKGKTDPAVTTAKGPVSEQEAELQTVCETISDVQKTEPESPDVRVIHEGRFVQIVDTQDKESIIRLITSDLWFPVEETTFPVPRSNEYTVAIGYDLYYYIADKATVLHIGSEKKLTSAQEEELKQILAQYF